MDVEDDGLTEETLKGCDGKENGVEVVIPDPLEESVEPFAGWVVVLRACHPVNFGAESCDQGDLCLEVFELATQIGCVVKSEEVVVVGWGPTGGWGACLVEVCGEAHWAVEGIGSEPCGDTWVVEVVEEAGV